MAQPIPIATAEEMIGLYVEYMTNLGVDMDNQTQCVVFPSEQLFNWMKTAKVHADEFKICLGVYPPEHPGAGRITTIIWPYKDGSPSLDETGMGIEPFNEGQREP
jgi:hypothetical protein